MTLGVFCVIQVSDAVTVEDIREYQAKVSTIVNITYKGKDY